MNHPNVGEAHVVPVETPTDLVATAYGNDSVVAWHTVTEEAIFTEPLDTELVLHRQLASAALIENYGLIRASVHLRNRREDDDRLADRIARFAENTRKRYSSYSDRDDSFQDAAVEFLENYHKHDPASGTLSTYMITRMVGAISRGVGNTTGLMRYPIHTQSYKKVDVRYGDEVVESIVREFEPYIAEPLYMAPDKDGIGYSTTGDEYLERRLPLDDIGLTPVHDAVGIEIEDNYFNVVSPVVLSAINSLPERSRIILRTYYGTDKDGKPITLVGTATALGLNISRERIRQIVFKSLKQIRDKLEDSSSLDNGKTLQEEAERVERERQEQYL